MYRLKGFYGHSAVPAFLDEITYNGAPELVVNPTIAFPAPVAQPWKGTGIAASPLLAVGSGSTTWNITFGAVGTFNYTCAVHYPAMVRGFYFDVKNIN